MTPARLRILPAVRSLRAVPALAACAFAAACAPAQPPPSSPASSAAAASTPPSSASAAPAAGAEPVPDAVGKMTRIPEASFKMGAEGGAPEAAPVHAVHLAPFDIDVTEVTVGQYTGCVSARGCAAAPASVSWPDVTPEDHEIFDTDCNGARAEVGAHPANCVDWTMADAYCRWAGKRLPTEEEWEYAACDGDCLAAGRRAGARARLRGAGHMMTTRPVAAGRPGPFGLYDMDGNVWEWTASRFCPYDRAGCEDKRRVIRGGSWSMVDFLFVRLSDRSAADPASRNTNLGFRCAKDAR
jgi:formylglycine-generating enzyme required for sulfatase activity